MDKKLTPLEAWEEIKRQIGSATYIRSDSGAPQITTMLVKDTGLFEIIDDAFTQLEYYKTLTEVYIYFIHDPDHKYTVLELGTMIKAVEIIKEKEVNVEWLLHCGDSVEEYNDGFFRGKKDLTKDEFCLLKKFLCLENY